MENVLRLISLIVDCWSLIVGSDGIRRCTEVHYFTIAWVGSFASCGVCYYLVNLNMHDESVFFLGSIIPVCIKLQE